MAVGVAILEGSVQLCAVDLLGEVLREETHPLPYENSDGYYQQVGRLVRGLMAHLPYGKERVLGVGIAIQGLVSAEGERVIYGAILNNTGATREMFQRYIPYPCRLLHDTEVGAAAEFWHNQEIRDAIYLVLNRNMGGALVVDGKVQQGSGIIEHMTLFPGGEPCYCGKKGCVEAYCSANSLRGPRAFPWSCSSSACGRGTGSAARCGTSISRTWPWPWTTCGCWWTANSLSAAICSSF